MEDHVSRRGRRGKARDEAPSAEVTITSSATPVVSVHIIDPRAIYDRESLRAIFKLRENTIRREVKLGRLRVCRRGGRYYFTGEQVWAWLTAGEQKTSQLSSSE